MTIEFTCPGCGRNYTVSASKAGKLAKCAGCGRVMTIPAYLGEDEVATDGYGLMDAPEPARPVEAALSAEPGGSVFTPARSEERLSRPSPSRAGTSRPRKKGRKADRSFLAEHGKTLAGVAVGLVVVLGLMALVVPGGSRLVAIAMASVGGLLILVGYWVGAWAAFQEDSLYGFLYVVIPLYSAYYIVTRWDGMWPWFATMTVGFVLVSLALPGLEATARPVAEEVRRLDRSGATSWFASRAMEV